MKKVVIVTECRRFRFNYGETLQAVALNKVITKIGFQCITASYENSKCDFAGWFRDNIKRYGIRGLKYEIFRQKNIKYPIMRSNQKKDFEKLLKTADAVICGSDCIWYEKDYNDIFFLYFPNIKIPKIAYAPSLRDNVIKDKMYEKRVKKWIEDFTYLSTREKGGSEIIEKISNRYVHSVLDPTFLISKKEWNKMSGRRLLKKPYILMYIIGKTDCMESIVNQVQTFHKEKEIVWIDMENHNGCKIGRNLLHIGPAEFLSLIRYADAVITDSFHGTAFSIIYQKQFYAIKRIVDKNDVYDNDIRIKNILELFGLNNYFQMEEKIDFTNKINYSYVTKELAKNRRKSINYLKKALDKV